MSLASGRERTLRQPDPYLQHHEGVLRSVDGSERNAGELMESDVGAWVAERCAAGVDGRYGTVEDLMAATVCESDDAAW